VGSIGLLAPALANSPHESGFSASHHSGKLSANVHPAEIPAHTGVSASGSHASKTGMERLPIPIQSTGSKTPIPPCPQPGNHPVGGKKPGGPSSSMPNGGGTKPDGSYHLKYGTVFVGGICYLGHSHCHWSYSGYSSRYGCICYWCPATCLYYYWFGPANCYYPVSYFASAPVIATPCVTPPVAPPAGVPPLTE
jgi:hypothetical protein